MCDPSGDIFVVDSGNERVQKFTDSGVYLAQWGSLGSALGQFNFARTAAIDAAGNVYVADGFNNRIQKFTNGGVFVSQIGSFGFGNGQLQRPNDVALDHAGNIYVADRGNHRVQKFTGAGAYVTHGVPPAAAAGSSSFPWGSGWTPRGMSMWWTMETTAWRSSTCASTSGVDLPGERPAAEYLRVLTNPLLFGSAEIRFALDRVVDVDFAVLSVTGQLIRSLPSARLEPGEHAHADGTGEDGRMVSQGVYFVRARFRESGVTRSRRILMLK